MINNRHAKRTAARKTICAPILTHKTPRARILMILLAFVAVTIQTFVIQSHIHIAQAPVKVRSERLIALVAGVADAKDNHSAGAPRDKYPVNEDPSNCPLCQAFGHAGDFVASTAAFVSLPYSIAVKFSVFSEALPSLFAVSHSWQGRAPPLR